MRPVWPCLPTFSLAPSHDQSHSASRPHPKAMSIYDTAGGLNGHHQIQNPDAWHHGGLRPRTLVGETFEGLPFSVRLSSHGAVDHGASAGIHRGISFQGPWSRPLVVAVKVFGQMLKPAQQQLLLRELWIASQASLRHPLILPFLGTVDSGDQKSLVSLYMWNGNLLQFLKSHRYCDKEKLILQVAEAVNYLHGHAHLVHGDLKCENVLISDSGDALLADFGLSTFVEKSQFDMTTMSSIRNMNTVRFAAPELLQGAEDTTVRPRSKTVESDVYAFGMLILQAVTELAPWPNQNTLAVMHNVCQGQHPPRPISDGFVTISHSWWDVCRSCWRPQPGDRPPMNTVLTRLNDTGLEPYRRLGGRSGIVWSVAYLPGRCRVVSGSDDGSIRIWDASTGRPVVNPLLGHWDAVMSVAVSPDGRRVCSGGRDNTIRLWDADSGASIGKPMTGHDRDVRAVAFSPDGTRIASCSDDKTVRLWDASTREALGNPLGHHNWVLSVAFSPDGANIAFGSNDGAIRLWDCAAGADVGVLRGDGWGVFSVCFSPDQLHLVSGDDRQSVRIWNISTLQLEYEFTGHTRWVRSVAVSPCGRFIASGSDDQTIRIWDTHIERAVGIPLVGHTDDVKSVAFSPDGRSVVSGSADETVRVWDLFE